MPRKNYLFHFTALAGLLGLLAIAAPVLAGGQEQVLYSFCSGTDCPDGSVPTDGLVFDAAGNLYGTATYGGIIPSNGNCEYGCGTVFELSPNGDGTWTESTLYSFYSNSSLDGTNPAAGLVFDFSGNLYGTTAAGGSNCAQNGGCGAVFELSPGANGTWTEKVLYSFNSNGKDAWWPRAGLIFDGAGNLYGTTYSGGTHGWGAVFELSSGANGTWNEKVLHSFSRNPEIGDGFQPTAPLLLDGNGNLYGTTTVGGVGCKPYGCGAVFELSPGTNGNWTEKVLHSFSGRDGLTPKAGLIFDGAGNLYGTASLGGNSSNCNPPNGCGTAFELSPGTNGKWKAKVLHSFGFKDGIYPQAALVFDASGNLYGTARTGGGAAWGTVFKLSPGANGKWNYSKLYSFRPEYGFGPEGIIFGVSGNLYGTTGAGGAPGGRGGGTVFELTP